MNGDLYINIIYIYIYIYIYVYIYKWAITEQLPSAYWPSTQLAQEPFLAGLVFQGNQKETVASWGVGLLKTRHTQVTAGGERFNFARTLNDGHLLVFRSFHFLSSSCLQVARENGSASNGELIPQSGRFLGFPFERDPQREPQQKTSAVLLEPPQARIEQTAPESAS